MPLDSCAKSQISKIMETFEVERQRFNIRKRAG
jgi:hypothetical protein